MSAFQHFSRQRFSFVSQLLPQRSTATHAAVPAMSLIPFAPFSASSLLPRLHISAFQFSAVSFPFSVVSVSRMSFSSFQLFSFPLSAFLE
jgi:hypothetical protein